MDDCTSCSVLPENILSSIGTSELDYYNYLKWHGVLLKEKHCPNCGLLCSLSIPGICFRCSRRWIKDGVKTRCGHKTSLRSNSWLRKSHLTFKKVCHFVSMWLTYPHPRTERLVVELEMSKSIVVEWSNHCRRVCINALLLSEDSVLGGPGITVEVYEAKFDDSKNNTEREDTGSWIFGCFERGSNKSFFVPVQDRTAHTLIDVLLRRIAPGTTIVSDRWKGYDALVNHPQFYQLAMDHSLHFVDPKIDANTQNIEKKWREVCSNIQKLGRVEHHLDGYLAEVYWKSRYAPEDRLHHFFIEVARQYDPNRD